MNVPLLIGSTAVLGSLLALWWAATGARPARAGVDLHDVRRPADLDLRAATLQRDVGERTLEPLVARLAGLTRRYTPRGRITGLEQRLLLAGASAGWTVERILAVKALVAIAVAALALLRLMVAPSVVGVLLALGIGVFGFFAPDILLRIKTDKRQQVIRRELADTVDQLTIAVQAGLGLDAAIARLAVTGEGAARRRVRPGEPGRPGRHAARERAPRHVRPCAAPRAPAARRGPGPGREARRAHRSDDEGAGGRAAPEAAAARRGAGDEAAGQDPLPDDVLHHALPVHRDPGPGGDQHLPEPLPRLTP